MEYQDMNQYYQPVEVTEEYEPIGRYTAKTFGWMFLGLLLTFLVAITGYQTGYVWYLFISPYTIFALGALELVVVLFLSARINKMSVGTARGLFLFYSVLNGIVFSGFFIMYQMPVLVFVFAATALFFGVMAVIGYVVRADLSNLRNFLIGGLVFLIVFWIAAMFINLEQFETIACTIGIFIFLVFTAYDTQKIKSYHLAYAHDAEMAKKASVFCALQLYLDFINLFLYLIRILGRRK